MTQFREAVLEGTSRASETHAELEIRRRSQAHGFIDIFEAINSYDLPLMFRPLDRLLGSFIRIDDRMGIMVNSERDIHLRRFTAAHELGHFLLGHEGRFDRYVGTPKRSQKDTREVEADAFAAEFLMPKWLFRHHIQQHKWTDDHLKNPKTVYQLALRMGVSYEATCWGLKSHGVISAGEADTLTQIQPKSCKLDLLKTIPVENYHDDCWRVDGAAQGEILRASVGDYIMLHLKEHVSSGYSWDLSSIHREGFDILVEEREPAKDPLIGGGAMRRAVVKLKTQGDFYISLAETRAWSKSTPPSSSLDFTIKSKGKDVGLFKGVPWGKLTEVPQ